MANGLGWSPEIIPDEARMYMRAHAVYFKGPDLQPGVFKNQDGDMSIDWEKYSTPQEAQLRAKNPSKNAVICLLAEDIRDIDTLTLNHTPIPSNRAHSSVFGLPDDGENLTQMRVELLKIANIEIALAS
jgi:hypothetical protein